MEDTLEEHLEGTRKTLSEWIEQEKRSLEETKQRSIEEIEKDRQRLVHLEAQKAQLAASASHREETLGEKVRIIQDSQGEVRILQAEMATTEPVVQSLRARKATHESKLTTFMQDANQATQAHADVVAELTRCIELYHKLGLVIDKKRDNNLAFVFTQIDRDVPSREFSFTLRVSPENDVFVVDDCMPDVPAKEALLEQLNASGNLSQFILSMRQEFVKTVLTTQS
ncbi:hypothetical protein AC1031_000370 [Aphanomyces cochlioides]|nr:hypothetical protein AC1031_000370 [Aphanomyces cochlioides]